MLYFGLLVILSAAFRVLLAASTDGDEVLSYREKEVFSLKNDLWWQQRYNNSTCLSQKSRKENGATILEMKHRDHCSGPIKDWNKRLQDRLIADGIRVSSIQSRIKTMIYPNTETRSQAQIPITSGLQVQTLNYIVTVTLGGRNMTVIVDTGSDLTWVQCQPCRLCYSQPEPIFNPSLSQSYHPVQCSSPLCKSLQFTTGNSRLCSKKTPTCYYTVSYGDGSYTRGELAHENLILGAVNVSNFVFGCGRNNRGLFGSASGLMGLGRSDLSMISQTSDIFGGVFSYCLPSSVTESSGSLILGSDDNSLYKNITPVSYTKMVSNPQLSTFYVLNLTGISIGGVDAKATSYNNGGILIDSGTVITRLPPSIYKAVKAEFIKQFSSYPSAPSFSILDTCYNLSAFDEVDVPTMKMKFEDNAELIVDVTGIFYFAKSDASQVCLALASLTYEDEIGIIGNYQQRNTRVIYNIKESKLGFAKETCSFM